jgi:predicted molibdopterin-dependent oxidoreductase YjgC
LNKAPLNQGKFSVNGRDSRDFVHDPERLAIPSVRKEERLGEPYWEEAFDFAISSFTAANRNMENIL